MIYEKIGKIEDGIRIVSNLQTKYKIEDSYDLIIEKANMFYKVGNTIRFRELLEEALKFKPDEPMLYFNLGVMYQQVDNYYKAEKFYKNALKLDAKYSDAYLNLGLLILDKQNPIIKKMNENLNNFKIYDELENEKLSIYKESLPYLEKAYLYGNKTTSLKTTLNSLYEYLKIDKRVY